MKLTATFLFLLALASSVLAGERAALLIGNAAYQKGTSLPALDTPPLDIAAMSQALRAAQFDVTVEKDLTTAVMREKVVAFTRTHREAEALLIYVSGHGVQVEGENYLPGVDADLDTTTAMANLSRAFPGMSAEEREGKERDVIRFTAGKQMVRLSVVLDALAATAQGDGLVRMIFLDTCRSPFRGAASKGMLGGKTGGGLAPVSERPGLFIGFAALANQEAQQNEAGHPSLFTEALAVQIRQPGLQLEQVFKRTSRAVTERSRALKKLGVIGEEQTPAAYSVLQEDFVFVPEKVLAKADPVSPRAPLTFPLASASLPTAQRLSPTLPTPNATFTPFPATRATGPKKVILVTLTAGFRHASIPFAQQTLFKLAETSGAYVIVDECKQPNINGDRAALDAGLKAALEKLSPNNLRARGIDAVIFANTSGDLPLPDRDGFVRWIEEGHAFIGAHSASDTLHQFPRYIEMLGGEFEMHKIQVPAELVAADSQNPANASIGSVWNIKQEEVYFIKNQDRSKVHSVWFLRHNPNDPAAAGFFPVSWTKVAGKGRVFYTSLGHREDLWSDDPALPGRINSLETARQFQAHLLGGIKWALGLAEGSANPNPDVK